MAGRAKLPMLIVEDDDGLRPALEKSFTRRQYEVSTASTVSDAVRLLRGRAIAVVLLDIQLPDGSGLDVLTEAVELDEETVVIMMTAYPEVKTAVRAMREGASDFVIKPFDLQELHLSVERAVELRTLRRSVRRFDRERRHRDGDTEILGDSKPIAAVLAQIQKVAATETPVLVVGETGTGKELVVDALHRSSSRADAPLVKVNCSAFSELLLESELFGHEKGAFTDAKEARAGLFEMADGGTLFLDEISEMRVELQARLLRVVEGQSFRRVGGAREIHADVRLVAATNRDLPALVRSGAFREDLYFRLNVFEIVVPPLRERGDDVGQLARFFLRRSAAALRKGSIRLTPEAEELLLAYPWPGNVRELRNVMERAAILTDTGAVEVDHLPNALEAAAFVQVHASTQPGVLPSLAEIERHYISHVRDAVGGNLSEAARVLGIARNTLKAKLRAAGSSSDR